MKRKIPIQFEMPFTASAFNLAGQAEATQAPEPAKILAEMTQGEREAVRGSVVKDSLTAWKEKEREQIEHDLAHGSYWSTSARPMAKALSTMQAGGGL